MNPKNLTKEDAMQLMKEILEIAYTDGIDELTCFFDEKKNILWGTIVDHIDGNNNKKFDYEYDLDTGYITY